MPPPTPRRPWSWQSTPPTRSCWIHPCTATMPRNILENQQNALACNQEKLFCNNQNEKCNRIGRLSLLTSHRKLQNYFSERNCVAFILVTSCIDKVFTSFLILKLLCFMTMIFFIHNTKTSSYKRPTQFMLMHITEYYFDSYS